MSDRFGDQLSGPASATPPPAARFIIAVGSGKGGVGKSTVSLNLALALAQDGAAVGLLDADLYGPNIPLMVGLVRTKWGQDWTLARRGAPQKIPPVERYGLKIMSAGFLVGEDQPLADASLVRALANQFMWHVDWGTLDYLIIDLPPGTADAQQVFARSVPLTGAILVVTPQDVAHLDAKKAVQMYRREKVPILGGVENMSGLICPDCGKRLDVFPRVRESRSIWAMGVDKLGEVPLDPLVAAAGDTGQPLLVAHPDSPQSAAFREIARRLSAALEHPTT
jgi:ATP-binding protein involved in chromosome partitioning